MMENYDQTVKIKYILNSPCIPDYLYRILKTSDSGSRKTNVLLNLIKHQGPDIGKIYLYFKNSFESKYQFLINLKTKVGIKRLKIPKTFIDYSQPIDDLYGNLEEYSPTKKRRVLIVFHNIIADMESNGKIGPIVIELFLTEKNSIFHLFLYLISKCLKQ